MSELQRPNTVCSSDVNYRIKLRNLNKKNKNETFAGFLRIRASVVEMGLESKNYNGENKAENANHFEEFYCFSLIVQ